MATVWTTLALRLIHRWLGVSSHRGTVMWKAFTRHDRAGCCVMTIWFTRWQLWMISNDQRKTELKIDTRNNIHIKIVVGSVPANCLPPFCGIHGDGHFRDQGPVCIKICRLTSIRISMIKIRQSHDRLIFIMGILIHRKDCVYIETGPALGRLLRN